MKNIRPVTHAEAVSMIETAKQWSSASSIQWLQQSQKKLPSGFKSCNIPLKIGELYEEGLFVDLYFKESLLPGLSPKFSVSLMYKKTRILAIDTGPEAGHTNLIGRGRPYFQLVVGMPHLHTPSEDGVYGYAEPLPAQELKELWEVFLEKAKIQGAPPLNLPNEGQAGNLL